MKLGVRESWKDRAAIDSVTPSTNKLKILTIPPGCTGHIQPCEVGIFGCFKKIVKAVTGHAQLMHPDYKMQSRDETLKMISLVWWLLCHPKCQLWAQYPWSASGYNVARPPPFKTPFQLIFPHGVAQDCAEGGCCETSFVFCLHCEQFYCFRDFFINYHLRKCSSQKKP